MHARTDMTPTERRDESYFRQQRRFREALVSDLRHRPRRREVHPSFSLFHAFENMARFNQHRLCILNSDNSVMGILTQSMIIDFLVDNIDKLGKARRIRIACIDACLEHECMIKQNEINAE